MASAKRNFAFTCAAISSIKFGRFCAFFSVLVVTGQLTCSPAAAAENDRLKVGGLEGNLPIVPMREPREDGGNWEPLQDKPGVDSFIETLKANDAAIEVIVGQGRLLTLKHDLPKESGARFIAVGDPTVLDFEVLPNARTLRLTGRRPGVTDLSITTADDQTYAFEVHVGYDLTLLTAHLRQIFPDALLRLAQMREHIVVEGEARSPAEVTRILQTIEAYLKSVNPEMKQNSERAASSAPNQSVNPRDRDRDEARSGEEQASGERSGRSYASAKVGPPQIINLIRVPGVQQVMLQVRIAELDRTATREVGADLLFVDPSSGNILGTSIAGAAVSALGSAGLGGLVGTATAANGSNTTGFGIFPSGDWQALLRVLRENDLLTILAEPNLVAMSGHRASFLAGGQFPVPVPQSTGSLTNNVTVEFKDFGVQLDFVPYVLDDETIRLSVVPEVSTIDFQLGTTLVSGGDPVPGLNTRRTSTTVEMKQGQTLAIAGLLDVSIDGQTSRIPGLGDLPYIGTMFSNTDHKRTEKELLVMVTPFLVQPMSPEQVPPMPGSEIKDPNDHEFYLMNRIESRVGRDFRSTVRWDDRFRSELIHHGHYGLGIGGDCQECQDQELQQQQYIIGPVGHGP